MVNGESGRRSRNWQEIKTRRTYANEDRDSGVPAVQHMTERLAGETAAYLIVQAETSIGLAYSVSTMIHRGKHVPIGGVSVAALPGGGLIYAQAMVEHNASHHT
jgi:hypothetical protein